MTHRIFVIDHQPLVRSGYAHLIAATADLRLCGEAGEGLEAFERLAAARPDLLVTEMWLKGMVGLEFIKRLRARFPELPVLVVSDQDETIYAERVLRAGACGYVMKSEAAEVILQAMRRVLRGGFYVSEVVGDRLIMQLQQHGAPLHEVQVPVEQLTDRELEVFVLMGQGLTTRQIAEAMMISPKTVDSHRGRIRTKLGAPTTAELARRAALYCQRVE